MPTRRASAATNRTCSTSSDARSNADCPLLCPAPKGRCKCRIGEKARALVRRGCTAARGAGTAHLRWRRERSSRPPLTLARRASLRRRRVDVPNSSPCAIDEPSTATYDEAPSAILPSARTRRASRRGPRAPRASSPITWRTRARAAPSAPISPRSSGARRTVRSGQRQHGARVPLGAIACARHSLERVALSARSPRPSPPAPSQRAPRGCGAPGARTTPRRSRPPCARS